MLFRGSRLSGSLAILAVLAVSACAQHGAALVPASPQALALPDLTPPDCKGQKSTKEYASVTAKLSTKGGSFCIPAFGGFGGTIEYPAANPSVDLTLTSSLKNYNHQPKLGKGKAIFYLQFDIPKATAFGSNVKAGGGLTGSTIVPGQSYTAYGQAVIDSQKISLGPCYSVATKGKYGGVIGGLGTLIENREVPTSATGVIEIYSGQQTSIEC
jgi:hypothetical protein